MELELSLATAIALFLGASAVVVFSAVMLARAGDVIAARTGLGHLWVGSLLIAGATSLPELVTNVTAVRIDNPGLAAGNILGANMLNVSNLAVIAAIFGGREIFRRLSKGQEYLAIVAFAMTALGFYRWPTPAVWQRTGVSSSSLSCRLPRLTDTIRTAQRSRVPSVAYPATRCSERSRQEWMPSTTSPCETRPRQPLRVMS